MAPREFQGLLACTLLVAAACKHGSPTEHREEVRIVLTAPGRSSVEVERQATIPIERRALTVPGVIGTSSISEAGHAVVAVRIADADARISVRAELLHQLAGLPPGITGELARAVGGRVVRYAVSSSNLGSLDVRALQDWTIRPRLLQISGVADVATCGGRVRQWQIRVDPVQLASVGLGVAELEQAIAGVQSGHPAGTLEDLASAVVATRNGMPVRISDVAEVVDGGGPSTCDAFARGQVIVEGIVALQPDAAADGVSSAIDGVLAELRATLPSSVTLAILPSATETTIDLPPAMTYDARIAMAHKIDNVLRAIPDLECAIEVGHPDDIPTLDPSNLRIIASRNLDDAAPLLQRILAIGGIDTGASTVVQIFGPDLDVLAKLVDQAREAVVEIPGVDIVRSVGVASAPEQVVDIDRANAARLAVPGQAVARAIAATTGWITVGWAHAGTPVFEIVLHVGDDRERSAFDRVHVGSVPLSALVQLRQAVQPAAILRENGQRYIGLRLRFRDDDRRRAAGERLAKLAMPVGYTIVVP